MSQPTMKMLRPALRKARRTARKNAAPSTRPAARAAFSTHQTFRPGRRIEECMPDVTWQARNGLTGGPRGEGTASNYAAKVAGNPLRPEIVTLCCLSARHKKRDSSADGPSLVDVREH